MTTEVFSAVPVARNVYWVGAIDWLLRDFHGYATERGTTYNAFLVVDEKVTLIDSVKKPFVPEMMKRISSIIPPERIDYIVSNHAEMDHSGGLPETVAAVRPEKLFASPKGCEALAAHFHGALGVSEVKDGQTLALGKSTLTFLETRMLHWPDSMVTYLDCAPGDEQGGILFSQDAFGMHLASAERFAEQLDPSILEFEATKYFANILMPYSKMILRQLDRIAKLDLPIGIVAPDHGPIYRGQREIQWILDLYSTLSRQEPCKKAVIAFDTMWGSTQAMATAIADGVSATGCSVQLFGMGEGHRSNVATALNRAGAFLVGSPTINNMIFPTMADLMAYVRGLRPQHLIGAAFGSYGWSGDSIVQLEEGLDAMGVERIADSLKVKYVPDDSVLAQCHALGVLVGERLVELCEKDNE